MGTNKMAAVLGGGSWGTALAQPLADRGREVVLLVRDPVLAGQINADRENPRYLPGVRLHSGIRSVVWTPEQQQGEGTAILAGTGLLLLSVPCQVLRDMLRALKGRLAPGCVLVNTAKGIEVAGRVTAETLVREELPEYLRQYAVLSGPSFAREVAEHKPTAVVLGCRDEALGARLRELFSTSWFRTYSSTDVCGVELGGAIKNVIAIAAGLSDGLGFGDNARAALVTRGLAETGRLGVALGAGAATFMGLSGLGDLMLTCTGALSRNRQVGLRLGRGETLTDILASMHEVAEGVKTTDAVRALAENVGVSMPVTFTVHDVLHGHLPAGEALRTLMERPLRQE